MRTSIGIGDINGYGVQVVGGPYKGAERGNSTKWDYLCPYCNGTFTAPTNKFKAAKSCYQCRGLNLRKSSEEITWRNHFGMVKGRKQSKEKGFDLTIDAFMEISKRDCYYCGQEPTPTKGHRSWSTHILTNGLDRIDSSRGYLMDNVVPCCSTCNIAKSDKTQEDFYLWIRKVSEFQLNK